MKKPNEFIEVFMSLIKWFLLVLLANNLIWLGVLYCILGTASTDISQTQDGTNNYQEMNNG